jgi:hypothetical protein
MPASSRTVQTLMGHPHVEVGIQCLGSLIHYAAEPLSLIIHDDGTLTDDDQATLTSALPSVSVLPKAKADSMVLPLLEHYPNCAEYRRHHPLALKLLDMVLIGEGELAYCDSDILFLKRFKDLFSWPGAKITALFMADSQEAYSLYPWHAWPLGAISLPHKINTGLIFFRREKFDLDYVEWLLGRPELSHVFGKRKHWIEQTCWAAIGWRAGCHVWNPRQLILADSNMSRLSDETVGIHFVAAYRGNLERFPSHFDGHKELPVRIEAARVSKTSSFHLLANDLRRRL